MASEKLKKAARENGKKGGRPKGSYDPETLERHRVEAEFRQRVLRHADDLFNAQFGLAKGLMYIYRIDRIGEGKSQREEHVLVTDTDEIKSVLDEFQGSGSGVVDENYYYISTKDASNMAIDSLLNRGIGKPTDNIDIKTAGEQIDFGAVEDLTKKLNAIHKGTSSGSDGETADIVDSEAQNKE